jgi:excisionase family DNA binding protein
MNELENYADILTAEDVSNLLGLHPATVRKMARANELPCKMIGSRWYFLRDEVVKHIRQSVEV